MKLLDQANKMGAFLEQVHRLMVDPGVRMATKTRPDGSVYISTQVILESVIKQLPAKSLLRTKFEGLIPTKEDTDEDIEDSFVLLQASSLKEFQKFVTTTLLALPARIKYRQHLQLMQLNQLPAMSVQEAYAMVTNLARVARIPCYSADDQPLTATRPFTAASLVQGFIHGLREPVQGAITRYQQEHYQECNDEAPKALALLFDQARVYESAPHLIPMFHSAPGPARVHHVSSTDESPEAQCQSMEVQRSSSPRRRPAEPAQEGMRPARRDAPAGGEDRRRDRDRPPRDISTLECWSCGKLGHYGRDCPAPDPDRQKIRRVVNAMMGEVIPTEDARAVTFAHAFEDFADGDSDRSEEAQ